MRYFFSNERSFFALACTALARNLPIFGAAGAKELCDQASPLKGRFGGVVYIFIFFLRQQYSDLGGHRRWYEKKIEIARQVYLNRAISFSCNSRKAIPNPLST